MDEIEIEEGTIENLFDGSLPNKFSHDGTYELDETDVSKFIGNFMLGLSHMVYFYDKYKKKIIHGSDKVEALLGFINNKYTVSRSSGYKFGEGRYDDLNDRVMEQFNNSKVIVVYISENQLTEELVKDVFNALQYYVELNRSSFLKHK